MEGLAYDNMLLPDHQDDGDGDVDDNHDDDDNNVFPCTGPAELETMFYSRGILIQPWDREFRWRSQTGHKVHMCIKQCSCGKGCQKFDESLIDERI